MNKIEKLTPEQVELMYQVRDEWLDRFFSCKTELNKEECIKGINWMYQLAGYKNPIVIFVDSPMACQYAVGYLKNIFNSGVLAKVISPAQVGAQVRDQVRDQVGAQVWAQVWDQVGAQVWAQVGDQVRAQVWDQVRDQVRDQVGAQVWDQVWDQVRAQVGAQVWAQVWAQVGAQVWAQVGDQVGAQVWDQVRDQVWDQVRDQVRAQVRDQVREWVAPSYYGNASDFGWVSWADYYQRIGISILDKFNNFKDFMKSGSYEMIQLNGFCIVSKLPVKIVRNTDNRLHNPIGPAIQFADGYKLYFINGRSLPSWIWEKAESGEITRQMFLNETNAEIKGGIYEVLGQKKMMDLLGAKEVDTRKIVHKNGDIETVTLLKTEDVFEEIDNQPFAWVKMVCPSTGTQYLQGVEPHHTDALTAIASLSMFKPEEYSFDMRS